LSIHGDGPLKTDQEIIIHTQETLNRVSELAARMRIYPDIWTTIDKTHPIAQDAPAARKMYNRARAKSWQSESPAATRARNDRLIREGAQDVLQYVHPTYKPRPTFQHHDREPAPDGRMSYIRSAHLQKGQSGLSLTDFLGGDTPL
jgi:hypothetical protein